MPKTELLTPKETAAYRRCSERKQDRERAEGRGPRYIRDNGRILYRLKDVEDYIAANAHGGDNREVGTTPETVVPRLPPRKNASAATSSPDKLRSVDSVVLRGTSGADANDGVRKHIGEQE